MGIINSNNGVLETDSPTRARDFVGTLQLVQGLSDEEMDRLARLLDPISLEPGGEILREGQSSDRLYFIESGMLDIVKAGEVKGHEFLITALGAGQVFGDMSFLDNRPVSATVRASEASSIWSLSRGEIERAGPDYVELQKHVMRKLAAINVDRLRTQNTAHVQALESRLQAVRMQNEAARFLILIVILFGIQNFATVLIRETKVDTEGDLYTWAMLLTFLVPSVYFSRRLGRSWESMGLTLRNATRSLRDVAWLVPLLIVGGIGAKWIMIKMGVLDASAPFFSDRIVREYPREFVLYLGHAGLQELGTRGIVQGMFVLFLGADKGKLAVLVVSLMFAILHLHMTIPFVAIVFFGSLFFGALYHRHGTLLGVVIVHYVLGILMNFLGFM